MEIKTVLLPIVTDDFEATVTFYKRITGQEVGLAASHDGYTLNLIGHFVILAAVDDPAALEIPRQVDAIFLIDDVASYWALLEPQAKRVLVPLNEVSTGIRFIIEQPDDKVIEYLQLHKV